MLSTLPFPGVLTLDPSQEAKEKGAGVMAPRTLPVSSQRCPERPGESSWLAVPTLPMVIPH